MMIVNVPKPRSYHEFQVKDTSGTPIKELRGVQVCFAVGSMALDFNAAECKTNYITLLVSENKIKL